MQQNKKRTLESCEYMLDTARYDAEVLQTHLTDRMEADNGLVKKNSLKHKVSSASIKLIVPNRSSSSFYRCSALLCRDLVLSITYQVRVV